MPDELLALRTEVRALRLIMLLALKDRFAQATFPDHLISELQGSVTVLLAAMNRVQNKSADEIDGNVAIEVGDLLRPLALIAKTIP